MLGFDSATPIYETSKFNLNKLEHFLKWSSFEMYYNDLIKAKARSSTIFIRKSSKTIRAK